MIRVHGVLRHDGAVLEGAYIRLVGPSGEFSAERRTDETGHFLFYPAEGSWTLEVMAPGGIRGERRIDVAPGQSVDVELEV
jgi:hypothetical protein